MRAVSRRLLVGLIPAALTVLVAGGRSPAHAQTADHGEVTAAGEQYRAGPFHRWILGRHYRDIWTAIIQVDVLDLESFAGGLEPLQTGGGQQTRSLRFMGADGREYSFRSVDKDPSAVLDSLLRGTVVDDLVQDGISAAHPYGALVAAPLLEAAGVLHVSPQLALMPDDPSLREFREEFAGVLGLIEERPDENEGGRTSFAGTARVIASERLVERIGRGPADQVDARAFLTARLMDILLGDWDRHRGQWRWAIFDDAEPRMWLPVPRDRDQAFSKFDGVATRLLSLYMPQFVRFEDRYPDITRLHWNGRELDRWFLSGLGRAVWDSVGVSLQERISDPVIEEAVSRLPTEIQVLSGGELAHALRERRDRLPEAWDAFYRLLANRVDVRASDADEVVTIQGSRSGWVDVSIARSQLEEPYFERRFLAAETDEIRLYLGAGDDQVLLTGDAEPGIDLRLIGGRGDDRYGFDSSGLAARLYDSQGENTVSGAGAPSIDDREYDEWVWTEEDRDQPRDWGSGTLPIFWSSYSSDLGVFLGGGVHHERYAFRRWPYGTGFDLRGGFAPAVAKGRVEVDWQANRENSKMFFEVAGRISRLDVIHYYGLGNATASGGTDFHEVNQTVASLGVGLGVRSGPTLRLRGGVRVDRSSTGDDAGTYFETLGPIYGRDGFVQFGATASLEWDPLLESAETANRFRLSVEGLAVPAVLDVERPFGKVRVGASALLAPSPSPWLSLAVQAGAERVSGRFPWHQAAFLGGTSTLRGWDEQRFAGDLTAFGSAEVRLRLWRPRVIVPVSFGGFGFAEGGRVWLGGESPGSWHTSVGGGIWFQPIRPEYVIRAGVAVSEEATKVFVALGLPY